MNPTLDPCLIVALLVFMGGCLGGWLFGKLVAADPRVPSNHEMLEVTLQAKHEHEQHAKSHHTPYTIPLAEAWVRWRTREILISRGYKYVALTLHQKTHEVMGGKT